MSRSHAWLPLSVYLTASISIVSRALAREWLMHIPLGAGIEEGQSVASLQWPVVGKPDLELAHVQNQGWMARMVAEDEVGVEFDTAAVAVARMGWRSCGSWRTGCPLEATLN